MSDISFDEHDEDGDQKVAIPKRDLQNLRSLARRAEAAEKTLAFAQAGIPLDDKRMSYFVKGYDGEMAPEAIKQAAIDAGFLQIEEPAPAVPAAERQAHDALLAASTGTSPLLAPDSQAALQAELMKANSIEETLAIIEKAGMTRTFE